MSKGIKQAQKAVAQQQTAELIRDVRELTAVMKALVNSLQILTGQLARGK